jgi:hypothetical protein
MYLSRCHAIYLGIHDWIYTFNMISGVVPGWCSHTIFPNTQRYAEGMRMFKDWQACPD